MSEAGFPVVAPVAARPRSRGRPRAEDVGEIGEQLLAVALGEFVRNGYGGTSLNQIVRAARISKTTLYQRYTSKEELFAAIMRREIERLAPQTSLGLNEAPGSLERGLIAYAERALASSLEGDLLEVNRLVYSEASRFPELGQAASEATRIGVAQIALYIGLCAKAEGIPCRDPEAPAEVFIHMLRGWYANVMLTNRAVTARERRDWVTRAVHALIAGRANW